MTIIKSSLRESEYGNVLVIFSLFRFKIDLNINLTVSDDRELHEFQKRIITFQNFVLPMEFTLKILFSTVFQAYNTL